MGIEELVIPIIAVVFVIGTGVLFFMLLKKIIDKKAEDRRKSQEGNK